MTSGDLIKSIFGRWDVPLDVSVEQAVAKSKQERAPESVRKLLDDALHAKRIIDVEDPWADYGEPGKVILASPRSSYGKSWWLTHQFMAYQAQGYQVTFVSKIGDTDKFVLTREGEPPRELHVWSDLSAKRASSAIRLKV